MGDPKRRSKQEPTVAELEPGRAYAPTVQGVGHATPMPAGQVPGGAAPTPALATGGALLEQDEGPDPLIGRVLGGHFKIEARIGEGGMGTVYRALHVQLEKHFAIKVLSKKIAEDRSAIERLRQEAQAASRIDHDNIVDVTHFDATEEGDVFIVMELLRGAPLAEVLENGPIELPKALRITAQICDALQAAHDHDIVHRDLKPENIFIVRKRGVDFVKVLDFGISKIKSADAQKVRMTKTGQLVGTPLYMSPEQAKGESTVDRRADIYALGVILYEMLTGSPPFEGDNYFQLLWKHGNEEPEPPSVRAPALEVPPGIEAAIMKTLAKDPDERFASMSDLAADLRLAYPDLPAPGHLVSMPSPSEPRPRRAAGRTWWLGALGACALLLAGLGAYALLGHAGGSPRAPTAGPGPSLAAPPTDGPHRAALPSGMDLPPAAPASPEQEDVAWVEFVSHPSGARVTVSERDVGRTPTQARLPVSEEPIDAVFELAGYRRQVVPVRVAEGARAEARLRRLPGRGGVTNMSPVIKMSY